MQGKTKSEWFFDWVTDRLDGLGIPSIQGITKIDVLRTNGKSIDWRKNSLTYYVRYITFPTGTWCKRP